MTTCSRQAMLKQKAPAAMMALLVVLTLLPTATGQDNITTSTTAPTTTATTTTTTSSSSSCICEGRGDLRTDYELDQIASIPSLQSYMDRLGLNPAVSSLGNYTCGGLDNYLQFRDTNQGSSTSSTTGLSCAEATDWMSFCCGGGPPFYQCANNVRTSLLSSESGYDKISIPSQSLVHDPVNVTVQMVYHTVTGIDEAKGVVELFVWLSLKWKDERLAWNYTAAGDSGAGTCTALAVNMRAEMQQGLKDSEIWVPEFDLFNQISGVKGMAGNLATVESDGSVTWFRQGNLKAICQMENLGQIPFESLGCQLLMGSKTFGVDYQLDPEGGIRTSQFAGPYNGYSLNKAEPGYTDGDVFFNFEFTRGTTFYVQNIILPVTIFSYCSILTMLVGVGAFQSLALNFTLLLTSTTQKVATARLLPVTNERLWLVDYVSGSFYFIVITLVEIFVKFIIMKMREERKEEHDEENTDSSSGPKRLLPPWFFTFSLRKMDVISACVSFMAYTIYIIVFFASSSSWDKDVHFNLFVNETSAGSSTEEL